ncbi:MAG: DUF4190 domain-containing protein [Luteolibacter sp.]
MEIFIQYEGQQTGPFSPQQIQAGLASGQYQETDLVWYQGMDGWKPFSSVSHLLQQNPSLPHDTPMIPSHAQPQSCGLALTSMILGICGFLCGLTAIPAVICGHLALGQIKRSHGMMSGRGFAIAGLVTGYLMILVFPIAFLSGLAAPVVIRQRKKADQTEAINNARSFGLALMEFEAEYGSFPNSATAQEIAEKYNNDVPTSISSNARFRQLFDTGITHSEQMFYTKSSGTHKPDEDILGDNALAPGECGFAYIENIRTDDGEARPLAMAPFIPGTTRFDSTSFDSKAVILWSDNSVSSLSIDRVTDEVILDGQNLLDPTHPVWGGVPPTVLLPEF